MVTHAFRHTRGSIFKLTQYLHQKNLQFKDENHLVLIFEGVVEVDELAVMEVIHDVDLLADQSLLHGVPDGDELGGVHMLSLQLSAAMDLQRQCYQNTEIWQRCYSLPWDCPRIPVAKVFLHLSSRDVSSV